MVSMVNNMVKVVQLSFIVFGWVGLSLASNDKLRMYVANIEETNKRFLEATTLNAQLQSTITTLEQRVQVCISCKREI